MNYLRLHMRYWEFYTDTERITIFQKTVFQFLSQETKHSKLDCRNLTSRDIQYQTSISYYSCTPNRAFKSLLPLQTLRKSTIFDIFSVTFSTRIPPLILYMSFHPELMQPEHWQWMQRRGERRGEWRGTISPLQTAYCAISGLSTGFMGLLVCSARLCMGVRGVYTRAASITFDPSNLVHYGRGCGRKDSLLSLISNLAACPRRLLSFPSGLPARFTTIVKMFSALVMGVLFFGARRASPAPGRIF